MSSSSNRQIRVCIVDDSRVVRALLKEIFNSTDDLVVVGEANDPYEARKIIKATNPDVLTLDVEMPRMDGIDFLKNLMRLRPMPVVMVSSLTEEGTDIALEALSVGAVDVIAKPTQGSFDVQRAGRELVEKVRAAAGAKRPSRSGKSLTPPKIIKIHPSMPRLIAIGASTGGVEAVRDVLSALKGDFPPIVVTQHIMLGFSQRFAERLDDVASLSVREAKEGDILNRRCVYVAPASHHLTVARSSKGLMSMLTKDPPVSGHRPSVDVLFQSVAKATGKAVVATLLTGMGRDGADGLLAVKEAGGLTIAQDEASSVVWGMPKAAIELGAAQHVLSLSSIIHSLAGIHRATAA
ncbi:MAG: chemotaxis response regulator protein-glutamate methylesterase [Myxococcota bacterium]